MLSRPGSKPGPVWMRRISDSFSDPDRSLKIMMPFWAFFIIYMIICIGLTHFVTAVVLSKDYVYESSTRIAGLPLVSYSPAARRHHCHRWTRHRGHRARRPCCGFHRHRGRHCRRDLHWWSFHRPFRIRRRFPGLARFWRLGRRPLRSRRLRHRQICIRGKWRSLWHRGSQRPPEGTPHRLSLSSMTGVATDRSVRFCSSRASASCAKPTSLPSPWPLNFFLLHVANRDRTWIYAHPESSSPPKPLLGVSLSFNAAPTASPTQHLTGEQEFWVSSRITPDVLILARKPSVSSRSPSIASPSATPTPLASYYRQRPHPA